MSKEMTMQGFVLLEQPEWDAAAFCANLKERWNLAAGEPSEENGELVLRFPEGTLTARLIPAPVPEDETEDAAEHNFLWEGAGAAVRSHRAHVMLKVTGPEAVPAAKLFVKAAETAVRAPHVLGICANGTVYDPEFYASAAEPLREDGLPTAALVWIGMAAEGDGDIRAYTMGMEAFGKPEMEILYAECHPFQLLGFLGEIAERVIEADAAPSDGGILRLTDELQLSVRLSQGAEFPDRQTLKIQSP